MSDERILRDSARQAGRGRPRNWCSIIRFRRHFLFTIFRHRSPAERRGKELNWGCRCDSSRTRLGKRVGAFHTTSTLG